MAMRVRLGVAVCAWWLAWGLVNVVNTGRMYEASGAAAPWRHLLGTELVSSLLWIPVTFAVLWLAHRWPLGRSGVTGYAVHLGGLAATIVGRALVVALANDRVRWFEGSVPPWGELLLISVYNNLFLYALITLAAHALYYARAHRAREEQLARAELAALRARIQPHFLFNTLNTIAAVVHDDPDTAEKMIAGLGSLLRRSLDSDGRWEVPLAEELAVLRAYLEIEQVRFTDRLTVVWEVDPAALPAKLPPMVLQPLAENAIRHGIWPRNGQGQVLVRAARDSHRLRVSISDDGVGVREPAANGVGLANTTARLRQVYGSQHVFELRPRSGGGTEATIEVPFRV